MSKLRKIFDNFKSSFTDDTKRIRFQFLCVYRILVVISLFMTVVNVFTQKYLLMASTLSFAVLCLINIILSKRSEKLLQIISVIFSVEFIGLLVFFIVSGTPEGFSAIWICLLPACGLLLFKKRRGTIICVIMFFILIFFFQTSLGKSFLQYEYTESFMLRFPMLYAAFFALSYFLESVRSATHDELQEMRQKYQYLYSRDALTGLHNRYGFNEMIEEISKTPTEKMMAIMIFDIDYFKSVNDTYGHINGDTVLKKIAQLLLDIAGENADVSRWGGEEFAVLSRDCNDAPERAQKIIEAIRDMEILIGKHRISVTVSGGIVGIKRGVKTEPAQLLIQADTLLYRAKREGSNRICYDEYHSVNS